MNPRPPPLDPAAGVDLAHEPRFQLGRTEVRPATLELVRDGASATVERKVMQALVVLARRPGEVTSRDELVEHVWSGRFIGEDAIHRVIAKLRQAAETHCGGDFTLDTIPRVGYRLVVGGVRDAPQPAPAPGRWRPGRRTWVAAAAAVVLAIGGATATRWWPAAPSPPVLRLGQFTALGPGVPAALPASLAEDVRAGFGQDNVLLLRERDPDFVMSGVVRRAGDRLRLTVRLDDARDGTMLWSGSRDWPASQAVAPRMHAAMATQIVRCGLLDAQTSGSRLPRHTLALYLQYCEARMFPNPQIERSLALARRVTTASPGFARGWSSLAYSGQFAIFADPGRVDARALRAEATAAANRAQRLDPQDAQAYEVLAELLPDTAWAERERLLRKAASSRLTACGCELIAYGAMLWQSGRVREGAAQIQRAYQREPLGTHSIALSLALAAAGDSVGAERAFASWSEIFSDQPGYLSSAMRHAAYAGRWAEAARLAPLGARPASKAALTEAFEALAAGDKARMIAAAPGVRQVAAGLPGESFYADVLAALGDAPGALDVLEQTVVAYPVIVFDRAIVRLRHEPRYLEVLERRGLIKYWRESRTRPDLCAAPDPPAFCKTL